MALSVGTNQSVLTVASSAGGSASSIQTAGNSRAGRAGGISITKATAEPSILEDCQGISAAGLARQACAEGGLALAAVSGGNIGAVHPVTVVVAGSGVRVVDDVLGLTIGNCHGGSCGHEEQDGLEEVMHLVLVLVGRCVGRSYWYCSSYWDESVFGSLFLVS